MSDQHLRILRQVARQSQRQLSGYDAVDHAGDVASTPRREYLERRAFRTRARVANAEQRRNRRAYGQRDTPDQMTGTYGSWDTRVGPLVPMTAARKAGA